MPLFKVVLNDRSRKIMISGNALKKIILSAKEKFELPDLEDEYVIVLEDDGTEIADTETLLTLAESFKGIITLMILNKTQQWTPVEDKNAVDMLLNVSNFSSTLNPLLFDVNNPGTSSMDKDSQLSPYMPIINTTLPDCPVEQQHQNNLQFQPPLTSNSKLKIPWDKFPPKLLECCENREVPKPLDRRAMVHAIANYLVNDLKDDAHSTVTKVVEKIQQKYPDSFVDKIGSTIVGKGTEKLTTQIYNRIQYIKNPDSRSVKISNETTEKENDSGNNKKKRSRKSVEKVSEYGCSNYEPELSSNENEQSQNDKKSFLFEQASLCTEKDKNKIKSVFEETYPTQRTDIIYRKSLIKDIFNEWPLLKDPDYFLLHSSILFDKDISTIWREKLKENQFIREYMKQFCTNSQNKNKVGNPRIEGIKNTIKESTKVASDLENNVALTLSIFPLLILYFKEKQDLLFQFVELDSFDDELVDGIVNNLHPILLIKSKTLFDSSASCVIVIEKKICIEPKNILNGLLMTFLSYCVFGLCYPDGIKNTLEFIQRIFIDINPETKSQKAVKGTKRRGCSYSPVVKTLYDKLQNYQELK